MKQSTISSRVIETKPIKWRDLQFIQQENFKSWIPDGDTKLIESILKYQFVDPFKVWRDGNTLFCLDGKHRFLDLLEVEKKGYLVPEELPATFMDCRDMKEAAELVLVYSSAYAKITDKGLLEFTERFDLNLLDMPEIALPNFDFLELHDLLAPNEENDTAKASLKEDFGIIPFSILDSRSGEWLERKRHWQSLGFDSQETREDIELIAQSGQGTQIYNLRNKMREALGRDPEWNEIIKYAEDKKMHIFKGASIFDPVLCELIYNWFTLKGHRILDPFAGGSVRGIVAGILEREYHGIDLRLDQVEANKKQALKLGLQDVNWYTGDSNQVLDEIELNVDFVFSCPPYHDLEQYSEDPNDLSNMEYEQFLEVYNSIIYKSVQQLKDNSFACFVVGDIRDKNGFYRNFVSDTIYAFRKSGMELYNEMILINSIGSMAIRLRKQFNSGRKCGKIHQNVLVFYKGDPKKIKENYPDIKMPDNLEQP